MVKKLDGTKNGFYIDGQHSNLLHIIDEFKKERKIRCVICNAKTAKEVGKDFRFFAKANVSVNNKLDDNVFYFNGVF